MKAKRVLAAVLCAAMIFSSEAFSMGVMASELPESATLPVVEVTGEEATPTAALEEEQSPVQTIVPEETTVPEETAQPSEVPGENPDKGDVPGEEIPSATPAESTLPAESEQPTALPEESVLPEVSASPVAEASETPAAEIPSASPEESALPTESASPVPSETPEGIVVEEEDLVAASSDFLEVVDGVLRIKEGKTINISTVTVPAEAEVIPDDVFKENSVIKEVIFEEGSLLTTIEAGAFEDSTLTTITIPAGVTVIEKDTFKNAEALSKVTLEGDVTEICEGAFADTGLTRFVAPDSLTVIGDEAFDNCDKLSGLDLGKVQTIGKKAFRDCSALRDGGVVWSSELSSIANYAFQGSGFDVIDMTELASNVTIGTGAFEDCANLVTITLPENLTTIPNSMLSGCKSLKNVVMDDAVTVIEPSAFSGCTALETIKISAGIKQIKENAFKDCSKLSLIVINQKNTLADDFAIAASAFPDKSGVTMKGYDGKVQDYADEKGYTFETLYTKYSVSVSSEFSKYASLGANTLSAVPGTEIRITVTPKEEYYLKEGTIGIRDNAAVKMTLVSCSDTKQVFSFNMPEEDVVIVAEFGDLDSVASGKLSLDFAKVANQPIVDYNREKNEVFMDKTGQETQIVVTDAKSNTIGAWLMDFTTTNSKVATVSATGVLLAKGEGTATITATLRENEDKFVSFKVTVGENALITNLELTFSGYDRAKEPFEITVDEEVDGEIVSNTYTVIEYRKSVLAASAKSFKVAVAAMEEDSDDNLTVTSTWKSVDTAIASVASSKSENNSNTINVKKGAEGETVITVSVKNNDADQTVCSKSFIVRVVDSTPRLADTAITVNSVSSAGTKVDIVPVYGYEISGEVTMTLCQRVTTGGIKRDVSCDELEVNYDKESGICRIVATNAVELKAEESKTYSGSKQLFIKGEYENGGEFYIPVPKLTIVNKALNPTIKSKGKINLFYNSTATEEEQGSITVTQSLEKETVVGYELVSAANHKKEDSEEEDTFAANFDVTMQEDGSALITRSDRETLAQVDKKDVLSGYLYIYYLGYKEPVKKSIKVATENKAPSYVLSKTSATTSVYREDQTYLLTLKDKKTKEDVVLTEADSINFDWDKTTDGIFEADSLEENLAEGKITLKVDGEPIKGKAVISVKRSTWSKALNYTFTLKTTTKHPSVKFTNSTVTLNTLCSSQPATLTTKVGSDEAVVIGFDSVKYTGSKKYTDYANLLLEQMDFLTGDSITVSLPAEEIRAMTYSFKAVPIIQYEGSDIGYPVGAISFKVTVKNNEPLMKLKKTTFALNALYPGKEEVSTTYTISNLPVNSEFELDTSGMELTPLKDSGYSMKNNINLVFDDEGKVTASLADGKYRTAFSYEYYVEGVTISVAGEEPRELKKFKIKVTGSVKAPSVSLSAKGTLNPIDPESNVTYTPKIKNVTTTLAGVKLWELKANGDYYYDGDGKGEENRISEHFDVALDENNKVVITAKEGVALEAGTTYRFKVAYSLGVEPEKYTALTTTYKIKPKQTLPKIKTDKKSAYLYAGQNRAKTIDVAIEKTSVKEAELATVVFAKNTPDEIKKAYRISFEDDVMTLRLVNPAVLVLNKKYTITFETKCKNQMENSTGTTFKLDVTVRK